MIDLHCWIQFHHIVEVGEELPNEVGVNIMDDTTVTQAVWPWIEQKVSNQRYGADGKELVSHHGLKYSIALPIAV